MLKFKVSLLKGDIKLLTCLNKVFSVFLILFSHKIQAFKIQNHLSLVFDNTKKYFNILIIPRVGRRDGHP